MTLSTVFTTIALCILLHLTSTTAGIPTSLSPHHTTPRSCTNHLANPSFESGAIDPWLTIVTSAWSTRGVFANAFTHDGTHHYYAHSTSTVDSTLTLSQSGLDAPVGVDVECYAWVAGKRSEGVTSVEVFLDGAKCGTAVLGKAEEGWVRVGGRVRVKGGEMGMGSTIAIVATSETAGLEGWEIWVDDVGVVSC